MGLRDIEEKRHKRADLVNELRSLAENEDENGQLGAEDSEKFTRIEDDLRSLDESIQRQERLEGFGPGITRSQANGEVEARSAESETEDDAPQSFADWKAEQRGVKPQDAAEYRRAFFKAITAQDVRSLDPAEIRTLSKASGGAGLYTVPTSFQAELIDSLREFGVMRQISRVITTDSGEDLEWPKVSAHGTASWTAENAAYTASDETFGTATLGAHKAATIIKVSEELMTDSAFDLDAYIRSEFGLRIGVLENAGYVAGDGSGKPTGVAGSASAGVTAAAAAAITADELIDLYHSLLSPYRANASWLVKDSSVKLVRKLKDSDGQYLWQPGLQAGVPDTLLGRPFYTDPDVAAAAASAVSALFGDFNYYVIRDVDGVQFQRLNELYAENGQIGFKAYHRTDGELMNTAAVKKLTQAAS